MRMAKASQQDIDAALELSKAFQTIGYGYDPCVEDGERISRDDPATCQRVLDHLIEINDRGSLFRVAFGMQVLLDPRNELVDPNAHTLEFHPRIAALACAEPELVTVNDELEGDGS